MQFSDFPLLTEIKSTTIEDTEIPISTALLPYVKVTTDNLTESYKNTTLKLYSLPTRNIKISYQILKQKLN